MEANIKEYKAQEKRRAIKAAKARAARQERAMKAKIIEERAKKQQQEAEEVWVDGRRVEELLEKVRLPIEFADRFPHQLSGGEKQRVAIARAFAAEPKLVICDEITAALDVSVQASVADLLVKLQQQTGTACLFITHDLNLVRQLAHRVCVMHHGRLVDVFQRGEIESSERNSYTRALMEAVPPHASQVL